MQDERNIPIDIHLQKLPDWLISRRLCSHDWQKNAIVIRQNIHKAIEDMPDYHKITKLLKGTYISYFHCLEIVEVLKETEGSSKNIFGQYSSQKLKDWLEIIKLYERNNLYLAESAQILSRYLQYDLPALNRDLAKCRTVQQECIKKEADFVRMANVSRENYSKSCRELSIEGKNIKNELLHLLDDLPDELATVASASKKLSSSRDYYVEFLNFTLKWENGESCLPLIKYIFEKGNTTTYEWRTGEAPDVIEVTTPVVPLDVDNGSTEASEDQIDFGDFGAPSESGDDRSSISPNGDFVHVEQEECKPEHTEKIDFGNSEINWDITVVETPETKVQSNIKDNEGGKVARGLDALTVLENESNRNSFYNDLLELEAFLNQRIHEIQYGTDDFLCSNQFSSAPTILQLQSVESINDMLQDVKHVSSQLMSQKLKNLYLLKESPRYVDKLVESLKKKLEYAEKMVECQKAMNLNYHKAVEQEGTLIPTIKILVEKTKVLIDQIQDDISKRYKNRPVNIMGARNILQQSNV